MLEDVIRRPALLNVGSDKQLFIDDYFLAQRQGVEFVMNPPKKTQQKLLSAEEVWEDATVGRYFTVIEEAGLCRMWYEAYSYADGGPNTLSPGKKPQMMGKLCYAESDDGLHWRKPDLSLITYKGSIANNIVYPTPGRRYHGGTVFVDPTATPAQRYKVVFDPGGGLRGGWSADGIHWQINDRNLLLPTQCDTQNVCLWDNRIKKYVGYVRLNLPVRNPEATRMIGRCETSDFWRWPHPERVLGCDADDSDDRDMYNAATVKYAHAENAYFIFTSMYDHCTERLDVQLAVSRDGITWNRPSRSPFIELGESGSFDRGMLHVGTGQIRRGDEYWIYYCGIAKLHSDYGQMDYDGAISAAILRLDGFISLDAGRDEGACLSKPITFQGSGLELNYQTGKNGCVLVEICDGAGRPLEGFSRKDCRQMSGDAVAGRVTWTRSKDLARLAGSPVTLRWILKNAKLYAFQFIA